MPVILLSARAGEEARVEGLDAGADDYLTKPFSARELLARVGANLAMARIRREAIRSLRELNETLEERVAARTRERDSIWRLSRELMLVTRPDSTSLALNPAWAATLGWDEAELVGARLLELVHPDDRATTVAALTRLGAEPAGVSFANRLRHRDGSYRGIDWTAVPGEGVIYGVGRDVTEARAIEERLRQAQKMETIGQLTGGVAHDFNNLLTVVIGNLENVQRNVDGLLVDAAGSRIRRAADNAMRGAQRAASLTQRLLAFARRQPLDPKPLERQPPGRRHVRAAATAPWASRSRSRPCWVAACGGRWPTPTSWRTRCSTSPSTRATRCPTAASSRSRPATPISTSATPLGQAEVVPGQYVIIAVSDTGAGMAPDTMAQAFEPFFTTKDVGHGTGLGLSQVYGFVKQTGGHVKLYSELGQGTTVKIYLPRHRQGEDEPDAQQLADAPPLGDAAELVLLVEDDDDVRAYSAELVRELGYRVLEAGTGARPCSCSSATPACACCSPTSACPAA